MMKKRWMNLLVAMAAFLLAGVIYAWSTIKAPFTEFGWPGASLQLTYTLTLIAFCLGGLISGLLSKVLSSRIRMLFAAVFVAGGFALVSTVDSSRLWLLYLGYGVLAGTGIGIAYNTLIAVTGVWFPDRKGLCSGCLMMSFGFSALLVGKAAGAAFQSESFGWRKTYLLLGLLTGAVLLIAGLILRVPSAKETEVLSKLKPGSKNAVQSASFSPLQMIRRPSFYMLFAFFFLLASVGSTAIGSVREVLQQAGENAAEATATVVGIVSICNGLGRLLSGAAFDGLGLRKTQILTSGVAIVSPLCVLLGLLNHSVPLAIAGLCLCGISYGFSPTITVAFVQVFYGTKHFALNLPILNLVLIPAAFMTTLGASMPGMTSVFLMLTGFSCAGLMINLLIRKP